jgi:crotonobetainyl-CoA:carnitine CoA-transferase CaiB-like acyl-CoA transferase
VLPDVLPGILDPAEAFHHPQVQALGIFHFLSGLELPFVSTPWSINGVRPPVRRRAPRLGEDNEVVLRKRPHGFLRQIRSERGATPSGELDAQAFVVGFSSFGRR